MADPTTNYAWARPTVGADDNTWGDTLNATTEAIDGDLKAVEDIATGVTAASNPAMWQKVEATAIPTDDGSLIIALGSLKAYRILLHGVASTSDGVTLTARFAFSGNVMSLGIYSAAGGYQNTSPAAGTFGNTAQTSIAISGGQNIGDDASLGGTIDMIITMNSQNPVVMWDAWLVDGSSNLLRVSGGGRCEGVSNPSHIQLNLSAGSFRSGGTYAVYGNPHLGN